MARDNVLYTAHVHTTGGRDGTSRSSDGRLDVKHSAPGLGNGTNPEQLLAAGWSACFLSAMRAAAAEHKVRFPPEAAVDAEIDLCKKDNDYSLQARLNVSLPGLDRAVAQSILEAGHRTCPYSKATRGNIETTLRLA